MCRWNEAVWRRMSKAFEALKTQWLNGVSKDDCFHGAYWPSAFLNSIVANIREHLHLCSHGLHLIRNPQHETRRWKAWYVVKEVKKRCSEQEASISNKNVLGCVPSLRIVVSMRVVEPVRSGWTIHFLPLDVFSKMLCLFKAPRCDLCSAPTAQSPCISWSLMQSLWLELWVRVFGLIESASQHRLSLFFWNCWGVSFIESTVFNCRIKW